MATKPKSEPDHIQVAVEESRRHRATAEEVRAAADAAYESIKHLLPKDRNLFEEFMSERREAGFRGE